MIWYDTIRYDTIWHDIIWYGIITRLRGYYRHWPPFLSLQVTLLGRFHLISHSLVLQYVLDKLLTCISSTHATDELNSVQFREAKSSSPFSYTRMPLKACETLLYPQPYSICYALLGSQGNTIRTSSFVWYGMVWYDMIWYDMILFVSENTLNFKALLSVGSIK